MSDDMHNLLGALIEQARAMAARMAGNPERTMPCHFCGGPLQLWENLLVMQLAGVPAHVRCPELLLARKLAAVGPRADFPYDEFSRSVDERLLGERAPAACSGTVNR